MDSFYDPNKKTWLPRNKKLDGITIRQPRQISQHCLQMFAQQLDLGDVYNIPSYVGMAGLLTSLVVMIVDLNLRMPHLKAKLN